VWLHPSRNHNLEIAYDTTEHCMLWNIIKPAPKEEVVVMNAFGKNEQTRIKAE